jgi:glycosyltransferase involved in cell wall biosynthesis
MPALQRAAVIGTIRPEKGQDVAIAAIAPMKNITLYLIGRDGDGAANWIAALRRSAPAQVRFEGAVRDTAGAIAERDIQFNLVPSRWESFGLTAIEGMACSCLTIVSGQGGLEEIAEHTGALIAPDAQSMRTLLANLCALPATQLADLARRQHESTVTHYAPERFETQIQTLLKEAIGSVSLG